MQDGNTRKINFRTATPADSKALALIRIRAENLRTRQYEITNYIVHPDEERIRKTYAIYGLTLQQLRDPSMQGLIATIDSNPVGYIINSHSDSNGKSCLAAFYSNELSCGIGSAMLHKTLSMQPNVKTLSLYTPAQAVPMLLRMGFETSTNLGDAQSPFYCHDMKDVDIMVYMQQNMVQKWQKTDPHQYPRNTAYNKNNYLLPLACN